MTNLTNILRYTAPEIGTDWKMTPDSGELKKSLVVRNKSRAVKKWKTLVSNLPHW